MKILDMLPLVSRKRNYVSAADMPLEVQLMTNRILTLSKTDLLYITLCEAVQKLGWTEHEMSMLEAALLL